MKDFELTQAEQDERLAAAVTVYGVGTKSYNSSAEKRESDRQRAAANAKYEAGPKHGVTIEPRCTCRSFRLPHDLTAHRSLKDEFDWRPWQERYVFNREFNCWELRTERFQERVR